MPASGSATFSGNLVAEKAFALSYTRVLDQRVSLIQNIYVACYMRHVTPPISESMALSYAFSPIQTCCKQNVSCFREGESVGNVSCLRLLFRALYFLLGLNSTGLSSSSCGRARGRLHDERNKKTEVGDRLESGNSLFAQTSAFKADELLEGNLGSMKGVGLSHEPALTESHAARSVSSATESWSQERHDTQTMSEFKQCKESAWWSIYNKAFPPGKYRRGDLLAPDCVRVQVECLGLGPSA